jgi:hypothetical protein
VVKFPFKRFAEFSIALVASPFFIIFSFKTKDFFFNASLIVVIGLSVL